MNKQYNFSLRQQKNRLKKYKTAGSIYWREAGESVALELFHQMAEHVPAYKDFLKKHSIDHTKIKKISEFQQIPIIDKENYIDRYPLHDLCWKGNVSASYMMSASSGSTGKAYFWPRSKEQTLQGAQISEVMYRDVLQLNSVRTLYIVAFAMGTWIAGTYMMMSTQLVAGEEFPITVVTPGLNKDEIFRLVELGKREYERVVLVGYPPFIKDIIDAGTQQGIDWKTIPLQFLFSGEAITEGWRDHLQALVGFKHILTDAINIYGSADVGFIAHETPLTITLRRELLRDAEKAQLLLNEERIPAIYQYDPTLRYFESVDRELLMSSNSGIPLCRYNTKDVGGLLEFETIENIISKKTLTDLSVWKLPLVYIYGRGKFSATLYGITIYPEYIKHLMDTSEYESYCTGKFVIKTIETENHNQQLHLFVELKEHLEQKEAIQQVLTNVFLETIPMISSEYKHLFQVMKEKAHPVITLCLYGDPTYFPRGVIKKTS